MLLYKGKAKSVYSTDNSEVVRIEFRDDATAFNGVKKAVVDSKGATNCKISAHFMHLMESFGIPTHFIDKISDTEQLCHKLEILPVEVVVRNVAAGSICRRLGLEKGTKFKWPIVELFYKSDELDDPMINDEHAIIFDWAEDYQLKHMKNTALQVNDILKEFWETKGITLVDFKIEFGKDPRGMLMLADEITPDGSRLWDNESGESLDKDVFRQGIRDLQETYDEVLRRVF